MTDVELTTAQCRVFNRAFDKCRDYCRAFLFALDLPAEYRTWPMLRALSDAVIVAFCVPFYPSNDEDGGRFSLRRDRSYFAEPELNCAFRSILALRSGVAHCDLTVTGERYTLDAAPGMDEHRYTEYILSARSARLIAFMADRLESRMFGQGWHQRRAEVGFPSSGTSTRLHIDEGMDILPDEAWEVIAGSWDGKLSAVAASPSVTADD